MSQYQIIAKTSHNLEPLLIKEIEDLGGSKVRRMKRAVSFYGDDEILYKANIKLRTAVNLLVPIEGFECRNEEELYDQIYEIEWDQIFTNNHTFSIDGTVSGEVFTHSKYIALKSKDAIVDRFRDRTGKRPDVDTYKPDIKINIHIQHMSCTVSLDASGPSLDKRGYRRIAGKAPMSELLATGMILMSNWTGNSTFYDPMSGSGTFGIEAAHIACNIYPALERNFCFENWPDFNEKLFQKIRQEICLEKKDQINCEIFCADNSSSSIDYIHQNAKDAGVTKYIRVKQEDFFQSRALSESGIVFLNPPYNERLTLEDAGAYYKLIGDVLKNNYSNHDAWLISSNREAIKKLGLRPSFKNELNNGGTLCKVHKYELYKGSKLS